MDEYEEAVLFTFGELESRLDRLEYLLSGPKAQKDEKPTAIPDRIRKIERSLQDIAGKTSLLSDANELLTKHKDILKPEASGNDDNPLDVSQKTAIVVERATSFATTASQLKALDDQQIPSTDGFTKLAMLRPRIAEAERRHLEQALKISELRRRSALMDQAYKQIHFLGAARVWCDYHQTCQDAINLIVREEFKRKPEQVDEEL